MRKKWEKNQNREVETDCDSNKKGGVEKLGKKKGRETKEDRKIKISINLKNRWAAL